MTSAVESEPDPKFAAAGRSAGDGAAIHRPGLAGRERRRRRFRAAVTTHTRAPWHICTHTRERRRVSYLENSIDRSIRETIRGTASPRGIIRVSCARARAEDTRRPLGPLSFSSSGASPSRTRAHSLHPSSSLLFLLSSALSSLSHPRTVRRVHVHRHAAPHTRVDTAREIRRNSRVFPLLLLLRLLFVSSLPLRSLWKGRDVFRGLESVELTHPRDRQRTLATGRSARETRATSRLRSACARDKAQNLTDSKGGGISRFIEAFGFSSDFFFSFFIRKILYQLHEQSSHSYNIYIRHVQMSHHYLV